MDDMEDIIKKSRDVKEYIKTHNLNFNIPWDELPEVPEEPSEEMLMFIIENFKLICLTDQQELLSYLMLVFNPESFATLLALLMTEKEIDIDTLMPIC
tara:strand:+ start:126 stop:419 length:294 start_codon:yes stop_codon:yes gene_type:complete